MFEKIIQLTKIALMIIFLFLAIKWGKEILSIGEEVLEYIR